MAWGGGERRVVLCDLVGRGPDHVLIRDAEAEAIRVSVEATQKPGEIFVPSKRTDAFIGLTFSADERWLAGVDTEGSVLLWELASCGLAAELASSGGPAASVVFSPVGSRIAVVGVDGLVRQIELEESAGGRGMIASEEAAWKGLRSDDATEALEAIRWLSARGDKGTSFLIKRMGAAAEPAAREWIAILDDPSLERRLDAARLLREGIPSTEAAMRSAVSGDLSVEQRSTLERILAEAGRLPCPFPELRRVLRSVAVLERIGTVGAAEALEGLSKKAPSERVRREAAAARERMDFMR